MSHLDNGLRLFFAVIVIGLASGCSSTDATKAQGTSTLKSNAPSAGYDPPDAYVTLDADRPYCVPGGAFLPRIWGCNPNIGDRAFFASGQYTLDSFALTSLEAQANWLKKYPMVRVRVVGNSDSRGPAKYNMALARLRAEAVKSYFVSVGIDPHRITEMGHQTKEPEKINAKDVLANEREAVTVVEISTEAPTVR